MTQKEDATVSKPQAAPGENSGSSAASRGAGADYQRTVFMSMALNMSWQLALVVIVPILGGHVLDGHYHKEPLLTLAGLAVAAIGVFGVLHRTVTEANRVANLPGDKS